MLCACCYFLLSTSLSSFFFFNDTATTEIYTLSLHDALPIYFQPVALLCLLDNFLSILNFDFENFPLRFEGLDPVLHRSEEHTSELQSRSDLVCRLLLEKKKNTTLHLARSAYAQRRSMQTLRY